MRSIKFRAWDSGSRKMYQVLYLDPYRCRVGVCHDGLLGHGYSELVVEKHGVELMQYTGLHDSKGVEIYEGDIVSFKEDNGVGEIFEVREEVKFENGGFSPVCYFTKEFEFEIIGNIWENKELVKP